MDALQIFSESLGIKFLATKDQHKRGAGATCAGGTIAGLCRDWGSAHATLVIRAITESSESNANQLTRPIILAVSDVLLAHDRWANSGLALLEAFDHIDLGKLWETAKAAKVATARQAIATLLCVELEKLLGRSATPFQSPSPSAAKT
jgi:hypothetical protein